MCHGYLNPINGKTLENTNFHANNSVFNTVYTGHRRLGFCYRTSAGVKPIRVR